ncbi:putative cyclin-dependent kinase F-2 [Triticum dicoccoides]|uniref:[RNA-polymerase]-subunit kinase n=1 Tax=Triticum aestivum TaxID=4565 RepID=A0A3B5YZI4_WHEAT|nr:putative cyclin-dependent kinase F-2 [Triticum dicoccoides]XP_044370271.1 putative cyclin-dependent kinase F-2 [Triticum aestivum]
MAKDDGAVTTIASRVASICAVIDHAVASETLSARRVAAISAMIHDVASAAEEGTPRSTRKWRRMGSSRSYQETRRIGEGRFGVVLRARHRATGQTVALKGLRWTTRHSPGSDQLVGKLLREACFMAACGGHPSVVALRGVARVPGTSDYAIVMEYVGPSLDQVVYDRMGRLGRPFTEGEVRGVMRQLLAGADAMHEHRIIHRDIKPSNVLVVHDGGGGDDLVVKICDHGLAMSMVEQNADGAFLAAGTRSYMAPEMLLPKPHYDTRVDMWSLGCVMAEMLTGEVLFERADTMAGQLYKIFDVLGVPEKKKALKAFKSPFSFLAAEVKLWRRQARRGGRLRELFPEKTLSEDGFKVLKGLLTCSPSKRLDAAAALRLPWFADADDDHTPVVAAVSKSGGAAASIRALASHSWQMTLSCFGRPVRSKAV